MLLVPGYFIPEHYSSEFLVRDRCEFFSLHGIKQVVYAPTPCRGLNDQEYLKYKDRKIEYLCDDLVEIKRFRLRREKRNTISRVLRYVALILKQYFLARKERNVDVIYGSSTPPIQGLLCVQLKKYYRRRKHNNIPFVYNLQDIFPDSLLNSGIIKSKKNILWKFGSKLENYIYKNSDKMIVISEDFKNNLLMKGVPEEKIQIIPNWADTKKIASIERKDNYVFKKYNLDPNKFYVSYSGNIGHTQNFDLLIEAAKAFEKLDSQVCFLIIGEGSEKNNLIKTIENSCLGNIVLLPFQPYDEIASVFSAGDLGIIISKPGIGNNSVPSKTWGYIEAKTPIIASFDSNSELSRLVNENHIGVAIESNDLTGFINSISKLKKDVELYMDIKKRQQEYSKLNLQPDVQLKRYLSVIESVVMRK